MFRKRENGRVAAEAVGATRVSIVLQPGRDRMVKIPESELSGRSFNPDLGFAELTREPVKALVKSVALHCAGCLNVPLGEKRVSFFPL